MHPRRVATLVLTLLHGACALLLAHAALLVAARAELVALGFPGAWIESVRLEPAGATFRGVRLQHDPALGAESLTVPWTWDWLTGRVPIQLGGARIVLRPGGEGELRLPRLPPLDAGLEAARLEVETPSGPVVADFSAILGRAPTGARRLSASGLVHHQAAPAWFAPADIAATIDATEAEARIEGRLDWPGLGMRVAIAGEYRYADGTGTVRLALPALSVDPQRPLAALPALAPDLAELLRGASGTLLADGEVRIAPSGLRTSGTLRLLGIVVVNEAGTVRNFAGRLAFASLLPLRLAGTQRLTVERIEAMLPVTAVALDLRQAANGDLAVARAEASVLGGRVTLGPLSLLAARQRVTIEVRDLAVADVLALLGLDGLSGSGRLAGRIVVSLDDDSVAIEQGEIAQTGPGRLAYAPASPPDFGAQTATVLGALGDLRTERVAIVFERESRAAVGRLRIEGRNPAFQDGRPVVLNVSVSGALEQAIRSALGMLRLSEPVRRAIDRLVRPP